MHVDLKMVKPLIIQEIKYVMKITFLVYYVSAYTSGPLRGPPWARFQYYLVTFRKRDFSRKLNTLKMV